MSPRTGIEWTDRTWNPVRGCSRVSEGCRNCYAERMAARFIRSDQPFYGFAVDNAMTGGQGPRWTGKVALVPEKMDEPRRWKKPCRVFVNSMSDLFHESLADDDLLRVFRVMDENRRLTFQVLTKRPERMRDFCTRLWKFKHGWPNDGLEAPLHLCKVQTSLLPLVLPNVWFGVSVENQETADERIPLLLQTPAALRFVSYEPALGPVDFRLWRQGHFNGERRLSWLICGGESGPGARPCDLAWIRSAIEQAREAKVSVFVKQLGAFSVATRPDPESGRYGTDATVLVNVDHLHRVTRRSWGKGGAPTEWPADLRVREFPNERWRESAREAP